MSIGEREQIVSRCGGSEGRGRKAHAAGQDKPKGTKDFHEWVSHPAHDPDDERMVYPAISSKPSKSPVGAESISGPWNAYGNFPRTPGWFIRAGGAFAPLLSLTADRPLDETMLLALWPERKKKSRDALRRRATERLPTAGA
jgi:hypothetical protein